MLWRMLPWKYLIRRTARSRGLIDPVSFLARLRSFAQPSEIQEPMELVRAGMLFQARGAINARVIQFNLDWVWPYWVERQFNPQSPSFIPRGYALTHVNLTHRNWTAAGLPDLPLYPLVDPRGMVTPLYDGWSLDFIVTGADGRRLIPSRSKDAEQSLIMDEGMRIRTLTRGEGLTLEIKTELTLQGGKPVLKVSAAADCGPDGFLTVSLRPYNPEGIQFIEKITRHPDKKGWEIDDTQIIFNRHPDRTALSNYEKGDVLAGNGRTEAEEITCRVGMATASADFNAGKVNNVAVKADIPLEGEMVRQFQESAAGSATWASAMAGTAQLVLADETLCRLFRSAKRTLTMLSAREIYPGPFTYRRFWFRDAVLMGQALLALNMTERVGRHIRTFPLRQKPNGYFESQEGEWDANGQVLWLSDRWRRAAGCGVEKPLLRSLFKGADWIQSKRTSHKTENPLFRGLLPAGFSAEHLGPNDHYYWDDFWGVAGLEAAAALAQNAGKKDLAGRYLGHAQDFRQTVFKSIDALPKDPQKNGIPAAPTRRMDAGAVGSMVADYPLMITPPGDRRIMNTLEYLVLNSFHRGGFFQDMIHSGINIYLTLALAQTLLRAGDPRFTDLISTCADLASSTGNWPEAIHPFSGGGCMGDGQHGWAAAEWVMMMKNLFVREEGDTLVLGSGLVPQWLREHARYGPAATVWGPVTVDFKRVREGLSLKIDAQWHGPVPDLRVAVPGYAPLDNVSLDREVLISGPCPA